MCVTACGGHRTETRRKHLLSTTLPTPSRLRPHTKGVGKVWGSARGQAQEVAPRRAPELTAARDEGTIAPPSNWKPTPAPLSEPVSDQRYHRHPSSIPFSIASLAPAETPATTTTTVPLESKYLPLPPGLLCKGHTINSR